MHEKNIDVCITRLSEVRGGGGERKTTKDTDNHVDGTYELRLQ